MGRMDMADPPSLSTPAGLSNATAAARVPPPPESWPARPGRPWRHVPSPPSVLTVIEQARRARQKARRTTHATGGRRMHTRYGLAMSAVFFSVSPGSADVKTREIEYRQGDTVLQGFIAWDDAARGQHP